jgi:hypothetical protein
MDEITLQTGETPEISISKVAGDLRLSGWDRPEFLAEGESNTLEATFKDGRHTMEAQSDATVYVPRRATVHIRQVSGDARIKLLEGPLEVEQVYGDLNLRKVASARIGRVSGDLTAQKVEGDLLVESAMGDVSARDVQGRLALQQASADLHVRSVRGGAEGHVGGDVSLNLTLSPGQEVRFSAGGDLTCRIPPDTSAEVTLSAGRETNIRLPGNEEHLPQGGSRQLTLGNGESRLDLHAGGGLLLTELEPGWELAGEGPGPDFGTEFARRLEADINEQINNRIHSTLAGLSGFGQLLSKDMGDIAQRAEQAAERARQKMGRVRERLERKAEHLQREAERRAERTRQRVEHARMRAEHAGHRAEPASGRKVVAFHVDAGHKPGDPVTEQEHLTVLRMLEQGKITVQQAEQLLAALEGGK